LQENGLSYKETRLLHVSSLLLVSKHVDLAVKGLFCFMAQSVIFSFTVLPHAVEDIFRKKSEETFFSHPSVILQILNIFLSVPVKSSASSKGLHKTK